LATLGEHRVVGLEVAVDDAGGVGLRKRAGDGADHRDRGPHAERSVALHPLAEALTVEQLHGDEEGAVVILSEVVEGDDVGVLQLADGSRLLDEALHRQVVVGQHRADALEGDLPAKGLLHRHVHRAHAAEAEQRLDLVATGEGRPEALFRLGPRLVARDLLRLPLGGGGVVLTHAGSSWAAA
jgi:hypothetical protein